MISPFFFCSRNAPNDTRTTTADKFRLVIWRTYGIACLSCTLTLISLLTSGKPLIYSWLFVPLRKSHTTANLLFSSTKFGLPASLSSGVSSSLIDFAPSTKPLISPSAKPYKILAVDSDARLSLAIFGCFVLPPPPSNLLNNPIVSPCSPHCKYLRWHKIRQSHAHHTKSARDYLARLL